MQIKTRKRAVALLLTLALLTVSLTVLLPVAASADPEEIQDFSYQTSKSFAVGRASTELRFVFTVGSLDYAEVGFVFSFEEHGGNATPEINGAGCYKIGTTTVYGSIIADGETLDAPDERYWVAAKVTNIPQVEFANWIYVRAFVTDGEGTRYSSVMKINPYQANRGAGETIQEVKGSTSTGSTRFEDVRNIYTTVLDSGAKHFYPTDGNPGGNDLLIEYSFLFNDNLSKLSAGQLPVTARIGDGGTSVCTCLFELITKSGMDSTSVLGAIRGKDNFVTVASDATGYTPAGMVSGGGAFGDYPNILGADQENPEKGWHRIGIRYHEEVTNVDAVKGGADAEYYLTVTYYVDGVCVAKLCANDCTDGGYDCKLFTAECDGAGGITYTDIPSDRCVYLYTMQYKSSSGNTWCTFADAYATCGHDFVQAVERVASPSENWYRAEGAGGARADTYYRITN